MAQLTRNRIARLVVAVAAVMLFAACSEGYRMSSLDVITDDFGPSIMSLYSMFTWISVIIFIIVEFLLIYAVVRFRKKGTEQGNPEQVHGHTVGEIAWTIAPALIVLFITIPTIKTIFELAKVPDRPDVVRVNVLGKQWWWHFEYPDLGIVTANQLNLPKGKTAIFKITSDDVIHSFWFPNAGGKRDATPGHTNTMYFTPVVEGRFLGACAEFCGTSHANMKMELIVQSEEDFQKWVEKQKLPAQIENLEGDPAAGRDEFMGNCAACHSIAGFAEFGSMGPDLTHVASRLTIGSGMFENNVENLTKWIKDPQGMKPGNKMILPQEIDDETVNNLVAFLMTLE